MTWPNRAEPNVFPSPPVCVIGTFWLMRLTHGEVQLLRSGPCGSQYPSGPMHIYKAVPGENEEKKYNNVRQQTGAITGKLFYLTNHRFAANSINSLN